MHEEHLLPLTKLVNWLLGKPVLAVLALLHIRPHDPLNPVSNAVAMEIVLVAILCIFFLWLKTRISVDRPGATQQSMEMLLTNSMGVGVKDLIDDIAGHGAERFVPLMGTIGIFILFSNLAGVIPGFMSPTAEKTVPLGCATIVFLFYNTIGLTKHGVVSYLKTLMGPIKLISPLMLLIETISHFARVLSLTVRLWANMMVGEMLYVSFLGLSLALYLFLGHLNRVGYISAVVPVTVPLAMALFHIFEAFLQAFIFVILSIIYLGMAVAEEH